MDGVQQSHISNLSSAQRSPVGHCRVEPVPVALQVLQLECGAEVVCVMVTE